MSSLLYLLFLRAKAFIRKLFSKPISAIVTIVAIIFFIILFNNMLQTSSFIEVKGPYEVFVSMYLGFGLLLSSTILFQKRTSLLTEEDANFLLVGPYTNRQIILYSILYSLYGAMLYGIMNYIYGIFFFSAAFDIKTVDIISLFIATILFNYIIFCFIDMLYVRFMNSKYQVIIKRAIVIGLLIILVTLFAYYYISYQDMTFDNILLSFASSEIFNYIPIIGWVRAFLVSMHNNLYISAMIHLMLLLIVAILITHLTLNTKDLDPEMIVSDALWFGDLKRKSKSGESNLNINLKVHEVKSDRWGKKARAISSRLMLDMRKTNSFITKQEIMLIILYLVISLINGFSFMVYARYVMIVLLIITMSSNYNDELKHHYIYLIPDKAINKLIALLIPTILKLMIVIGVMLMFGIILKTNLLEFILAFIELIGYALIFVSANIWSLRILKSNNNQLANQFIKMFIIIIAIIPSIILGLLLGFITDFTLFSLFSSLINIIVACIFIWASIGVVSGVNLMDE